MLLQDPRMLTAIHVFGPKQTPDYVEGTLHYLMSYRLQNHALDLMKPNASGDALFIMAYYHHANNLKCTHIPRHLGMSSSYSFWKEGTQITKNFISILISSIQFLQKNNMALSQSNSTIPRKKKEQFGTHYLTHNVQGTSSAE